MSWLFPQISRPDAEQLIELFNADPANRCFSGVEHPQRFYQASGGDRLPDEELKDARAAILAIAEKSGFPDQPPSSTRNQDYAKFEAAVAEWFAGWLALDVERPGVAAETSRRDWWSYLTLVVLPDVACWRWVSETQGNLLKHERFLGGGRNTFQRIHRRVLCLDRGTDHPDRFGLIRELKEDDFSAILERPSLSSSPRIARMIAEELLLMRARLSEAGWGLGQQQPVYRQAIKDLCAYGIVTVFDLLDDAQLKDVVRESFLQCEIRLKRDVPQPDDSEGQGKRSRLIGAFRYLLSGSSEPAADDGSA